MLDWCFKPCINKVIIHHSFIHSQSFHRMRRWRVCWTISLSKVGKDKMEQNFRIFHFGSVKTEKYLVKLHCEHRFLSCMAFSVYIVVHVHIVVQTNDAIDKRRERLYLCSQVIGKQKIVWDKQAKTPLWEKLTVSPKPSERAKGCWAISQAPNCNAKVVVFHLLIVNSLDFFSGWIFSQSVCWSYWWQNGRPKHPSWHWDLPAHVTW